MSIPCACLIRRATSADSSCRSRACRKASWRSWASRGGDEAGVPVTAPPDQTLELRVTITVPPDVQLPPSTPVQMILTDAKTGETVKNADFFKAP